MKNGFTFYKEKSQPQQRDNRENQCRRGKTGAESLVRSCCRNESSVNDLNYGSGDGSGR